MNASIAKVLRLLKAALGIGALAGLVLGIGRSATGAERGPMNLDLEEGELGKPPAGWLVPRPTTDAGYTVELTEERPHTGKRCVLIHRDAVAPGSGFGNILQFVDAAPYRGKRIRFKAAVRAEVSGQGNQAQLWLRVDRPDTQLGFFDNMGNRPIIQADWRDYEIAGDVAEDAVSIYFGMFLLGHGRAWLDSASFEVLGETGEGNEPARPLEARGLDNLVAFTRLLGYIRYFHPSDDAAATNWESFAIEGVSAVEGASSPDELVRILTTLLVPIAPTVRVFPTGQEPRPQPGDGEQPPGQGPHASRLLGWRHVGVGTGSPKSIYSSTRVNLKDPATILTGLMVPGLKPPEPDRPFAAELGGGVSCVIPLVLPADEQGTLPRVQPALAPASSTRPPGFQPSGNDRATRLADVALAWNVFQHFYPYFDVVNADWPGALRRGLTAAAIDADERAFHDTLRGLVAALDDGHGNVYLSGISAPLFFPPMRWDWIEDRLVITRVGARGQDGLKPGDVVIAIDGRPTADVLAENEQLISGATPQWKRFKGLRAMVGGARDSALVLDIRPESGAPRTARLRRTLPPSEFEELKEVRPEPIAELKPGVFYVDIDRVRDPDFAAAVPRLAEARGIVFDLRGYPKGSVAPIAHLIDQPVTSARWNVPVTFEPDRRNVVFTFSNWPVAPELPRFPAKVAFLTDGRAISYAETYLGIIEHYKLADIVGSPTAGTNGNINRFPLPGGYELIWTGMKVLKHDGSRHHGVGIQPTVPVARTIAGVAAGRDEVLERAIERVGQ